MINTRTKQSRQDPVNTIASNLAQVAYITITILELSNQSARWDISIANNGGPAITGTCSLKK